LDAEQSRQLIRLLTNFYRKHQHSYVPPYQEYKSLFDLLQLARKQKDTLSEETLHKLNALNIDWQVGNQLSRWFFNYYELHTYYQEHGHTNLPFHYAENPRLGAWVNRQKKKKDSLTKEQILLLEQLDFTWLTEDTSLSKRWEKMYRKLVGYVKEHHHAMVPSTYQDQALAKWVIYQRKNVERLTPKQKEKLDALGFVFDVQEQRQLIWEYRFQQLCAFKDKEGHTNVPSLHKNKQLYNWVRTLRMNYDALEKEQLAKLKSIGFEFSQNKQAIRDQQWMENYAQIEEFYRKHGHLDVPDRRLYQWLYKQKLRWPKDPQRQKLLKAIGVGEE